MLNDDDGCGCFMLALLLGAVIVVCAKVFDRHEKETKPQTTQETTK